mmetsp:Transcript_31308/g.53462  ORF Transcript_31308/g.53462 Transcript_31308/m.53462 type:complete len:98 (-) Transcript_31308:173-466(-)
MSYAACFPVLLDCGSIAAFQDVKLGKNPFSLSCAVTISDTICPSPFKIHSIVIHYPTHAMGLAVRTHFTCIQAHTMELVHEWHIIHSLNTLPAQIRI